MTSTRVVNAWPLILLAKIGRLELPWVGGFEVQVSDAVIAEIEAKGIHDPAAVTVRCEAFVACRPSSHSPSP